MSDHSLALLASTSLRAPKSANGLHDSMWDDRSGEGDGNKLSREKRLRRSEIEKKSRRKREDKIATMQRQIDDLEQQYRRLVLLRDRSTIDRRTSTQGRYAELTATVHGLRNEQLLLRKQLRQWDTCQNVITSALHAKREHTTDIGKLENTLSAFTRPPTTRSAAIRAAYTPLTETSYSALVRSSCDIIDSFDISDGISTGGACFGYMDRRRLDTAKGSVVFTFTKSFRHRTAQELAKTIWVSWSDRERLQEVVYGNHARTEVQTLQVLDEDAIVLHRVADYDQATYHTVYILFTLRIDHGYLVVMRTLPSTTIRSRLQEREQWMENFMWAKLTNARDEAEEVNTCELEFGGSLAHGMTSFASHWMVELVMSLVRWENFSIGPVFLRDI